eukprot:1160150-Pelagomonas_calceolata.AAC.5
MAALVFKKPVFFRGEDEFDQLVKIAKRERERERERGRCNCKASVKSSCKGSVPQARQDTGMCCWRPDSKALGHIPFCNLCGGQDTGMGCWQDESICLLHLFVLQRNDAHHHMTCLFSEAFLLWNAGMLAAQGGRDLLHAPPM